MKGAIESFREWRTVCRMQRECRECPVVKICPSLKSPMEMTDGEIISLINIAENAARKAEQNEDS